MEGSIKDNENRTNLWAPTLASWNKKPNEVKLISNNLKSPWVKNKFQNTNALF